MARKKYPWQIEGKKISKAATNALAIAHMLAMQGRPDLAEKHFQEYRKKNAELDRLFSPGRPSPNETGADE